MQWSCTKWTLNHQTLTFIIQKSVTHQILSFMINATHFCLNQSEKSSSVFIIYKCHMTVFIRIILINFIVKSLPSNPTYLWTLSFLNLASLPLPSILTCTFSIFSTLSMGQTLKRAKSGPKFWLQNKCTIWTLDEIFFILCQE